MTAIMGISILPFAIMSLSSPSNGRCILLGPLKNTYEITYSILTTVARIAIHGVEWTQRPEIRKLPLVIILHLKQ